MVKQTQTQQKCPFPDECPHGPKREGYSCGMAFKLTHGAPDDPNATVELICTYCFAQIQGFKLFLAARKASRGGGLVVPGPGMIPPDVLAGPGNNNGKG